MILLASRGFVYESCKPRASGDDPLPLWATPYESA